MYDPSDRFTAVNIFFFLKRFFKNVSDQSVGSGDFNISTESFSTGTKFNI